MDDRIGGLEGFASMSATLSRIMNERVNAMEDRQEEWQRRTEDWQRRTEEWQRQTEESQRERDELMQQLLQAVAVMQADIVRIDETRN